MVATLPKKTNRRKKVNRLIVVKPNAAGIDLGSKTHYVAVPPGYDPAGQDIRNFDSHTPGLRKMADWLINCGVDTVAMETTGVYWIPVYDILAEAGLEVHLVHAAHLKYVPGRKSDVMDCEWIQQVHSFGLLQGCFRPETEVIQLRTLVRHRKHLIEDASRYILLMQKALNQMNVLVHQAVTDITGKTGMRIIRSIVNGTHDPQILAGFRDNRCKKKPEEIADALDGNFRGDYLFTLKHALESYDHIQNQLADCNRELEAMLSQWEPKIDLEEKSLPARRGRAKPQGNEPTFDLRKYLFQIAGVDLTQIEGIQASVALVILSEHGADMTPWPTGRQYASWLGLSPGSRITGGKNKSGQTRKVSNRVAAALRMAASSLSRSQGPLGHLFRRLCMRLNRAQVVTAVAHKLARIVYAMLKNGTEYEPGLHERDPEAARKKAVKRIQKKAKALNLGIIDATTGEILTDGL